MWSGTLTSSVEEGKTVRKIRINMIQIYCRLPDGQNQHRWAVWLQFIAYLSPRLYRMLLAGHFPSRRFTLHLRKQGEKGVFVCATWKTFRSEIIQNTPLVCFCKHLCLSPCPSGVLYTGRNIMRGSRHNGWAFPPQNCSVLITFSKFLIQTFGVSCIAKPKEPILSIWMTALYSSSEMVSVVWLIYSNITVCQSVFMGELACLSCSE